MTLAERNYEFTMSCQKKERSKYEYSICLFKIWGIQVADRPSTQVFWNFYTAGTVVFGLINTRRASKGEGGGGGVKWTPKVIPP